MSEVVESSGIFRIFTTGGRGKSPVWSKGEAKIGKSPRSFEVELISTIFDVLESENVT